MKSPKYSLARKAYWAKMTPEERSIKLRVLAVGRQKKMSFKQKREHALLMVAAKRKKHKEKVEQRKAPLMV